jgi:type IV secretory pathway TrbD component
LVVPLWTVVLALVLATPTHPLTLSLALLLGMVGHALLVRAAKTDPYWFDIYWRTLHYRSFYPAHSSVSALPSRVSPSVPRA